MPSCYSSGSSREAMMMGDRQVTYRVLWCLWQYVRMLETRGRNAVDRLSSETPSEPIDEMYGEDQGRTEADTRSLVLKSKQDLKSALCKMAQPSSKVCPLMNDIPAVVLACEEKGARCDNVASGGPNAVESTACRLDAGVQWRCEQPFDDDLFPQPSRGVLKVLAPPHACDAESNLLLDLEPKLAAQGRAEGDEAQAKAEDDHPAATTIGDPAMASRTSLACSALSGRTEQPRARLEDEASKRREEEPPQCPPAIGASSSEGVAYSPESFAVTNKSDGTALSRHE